ncbi:MAG: hypothetical protein ABXS91_08680 [Sulfurimonas sp.]
MVVSVEKDGKNIIPPEFIRYTLVTGYIYEIPLIIEIGSDYHLLNDNDFTIGESYKVVTRYGKEIELVLSDIEPNSDTVSNRNYTGYTFMHEESYNLSHNKYSPEHKVFGISLENYIIGSNNQLKIAIFELRKKGLFLSVDKDFKIAPRHVKEYDNEEDQYIIQQVTAQKIHLHPQRKNYSAIEPDGTLTRTESGSDIPKYIPGITNNEIKGLSLFITPRFIIQSSNENSHLQLGHEATFKEQKYCIIEKNVIFMKNSAKSVITIGSV